MCCLNQFSITSFTYFMAKSLSKKLLIRDNFVKSGSIHVWKFQRQSWNCELSIFTDLFVNSSNQILCDDWFIMDIFPFILESSNSLLYGIGAIYFTYFSMNIYCWNISYCSKKESQNVSQDQRFDTFYTNNVNKKTATITMQISWFEMQGMVGNRILLCLHRIQWAMIRFGPYYPIQITLVDNKRRARWQPVLNSWRIKLKKKQQGWREN